MPQSRAQKRINQKLQVSPYDDLLCFNMYKGWRAIQELYSSTFSSDMNPQRSYVLGLCLRESATVSQISSVLQIDDAAVSNMIKRMEKDGLVKRKRSTKDKRSIEVVATAYGRKSMQEIEKRTSKIDKQLYGRVSHKDLIALKRVVTAICE